MSTTASDFLGMWVVVALILLAIILLFNNALAQTTPGSPAPPAITAPAAAAGPSVREKVFYSLALAGLRAALYKYCPHLSQAQHDLVVSTLIKWKEREYKQPSILVPLLWLCARGRAAGGDDRVVRELTRVLTVFSGGAYHHSKDDDDMFDMRAPPAYAKEEETTCTFSPCKEADESFCKEFGLDSNLMCKVPLQFRGCLEETLRSGKNGTCPITLEALQDADTNKIVAGLHVSVLFRTTGGKHYAQLFSTDALEHWFESGHASDPMTGAATARGTYYRLAQ